MLIELSKTEHASSPFPLARHLIIMPRCSAGEISPAVPSHRQQAQYPNNTAPLLINSTAVFSWEAPCGASRPDLSAAVHWTGHDVHTARTVDDCSAWDAQKFVQVYRRFGRDKTSNVQSCRLKMVAVLYGVCSFRWRRHLRWWKWIP